MNIGNNPTVEGALESIEIHFFDFDQNLYHTEIAVDLLSRIRNEIKFDTLNDLKSQLNLDKKHSMDYILNIV
jgi:riboflavin kinase/FMN adenylyltransferase